MKRWPIIALLLVVAGTSATAVYFYRENLALRRQLAARTAPEAAKPKPTVAAGPQVASADASATDAAAPSSTEEGAAGDRANGQNRGQRGNRANRGAEAMARVLTDPEMREAMLTRNKAQIDRIYGGLFIKLGLTEDQTDMLRGLLAERQMARMEGGLMQRTATDDASKEQARAWRDAQAKSIDAGIEAILGPDGSKLLDDYQRTTPQRMAVDEINRRASYAGAPLAPEASDRLVQVIAAAQEAVPVPNDLLRPNWQGGRGPGGQNNQAAAATDGQSQGQAPQRQQLTPEAVNQYIAAQQAQNDQILAEARSFLTQAQLEALAAQQLDQLEQTQAQLNFRLKNPDMRGGFGGPGAFGGGGFRGGRNGGGGGNRGGGNNNATGAQGGG